MTENYMRLLEIIGRGSSG